jgi:hypothetical protein
MMSHALSSEDQGKTVGDFRFGLDSEEKHARFTESLYREWESLDDLGAVAPGATYNDIADAVIDTVANYAGMGPVPATELVTLIRDALEQLAVSGVDELEPV